MGRGRFRQDLGEHFAIGDKMTTSKSKMPMHINYKMKILLRDGRVFIGFFKALDKHMIVSDTVETRKLQHSADESRHLGLVLVLGEDMTVVEQPHKGEAFSHRLKTSGSLGYDGTSRPVAEYCSLEITNLVKEYGGSCSDFR